MFLFIREDKTREIEELGSYCVAETKKAMVVISTHGDKVISLMILSMSILGQNGRKASLQGIKEKIKVCVVLYLWSYVSLGRFLEGS